MKKKLLLAMVIVGLLVSGCAKTPTLKNGQEVIAKINGKDFTVEDLYEELKDQGGYQVLVNMIDTYIANKEVPDNADSEQYADGQIAALKAQTESYGQDYMTTINSYGFKNETELKDYFILTNKLQKVTEKYVKKTIKDKEVEKYYKDNVYGEMTVRHILISPETTEGMTDDQKKTAENDALKQAKDIIAKLNKGEKFEDLAKEHSDDTGTASEGGLYANFVKGDGTVDEFWNASVKLKDNEYTKEPVKTQFGYHIILRVKQNAKPKLEDVKEDILSTMVQDMLKQDQNLEKKTWADIRKDYKLDLIDTEIKKAYNANYAN
ncbi:MAG: peptidylprolyl isomerase [Bacilli bacterium]|nr:peptidylprolyl isomerase [Bacilli bacterium]MDD4608453.1 peptidylprolyl isomerase [Bacilli bacterium]